MILNYSQLIKGCWQRVLMSLPTSGPLNSSPVSKCAAIVWGHGNLCHSILDTRNTKGGWLGSVQGISRVDRVLRSAWILRPDVRKVAYLYRRGLEEDFPLMNKTTLHSCFVFYAPVEMLFISQLQQPSWWTVEGWISGVLTLFIMPHALMSITLLTGHD